MFGKKHNGPLCHYDKEPCIKERCKQWVAVKGKHPQTGMDLDTWDCAETWEHVLLLELIRKQNETASAIEDFRNHMIAGNKMTLKALVASAQLRAIEEK